jgi:ABC-2 type transport system permease protein
MLYPVVWKELRDMLRDIRTLAVIALMPLVMMPLMGMASIYVQNLQPGIVVINDNDRCVGVLDGKRISSEELVKSLTTAFLNAGFKVLGNTSSINFSNISPDLIVTIPHGFTKNATSLNSTACLEVSENVASSKSQEAIGILNSIVSEFSHNLSASKVLYLSELASVKIKVDAILEPVKTSVTLIGPSGRRASYGETLRIAMARVLAFSLVFVTTPSIAYITDSIVGEKERKTFEALLATPLPRWSIIIGKTLSTSIIGLVTGMTDAVGLLLFFTLPSLTYGINMIQYLTPRLIFIHSLAVYLSVLASLAIILPIVIRSGSYRVAQAFSLIIISLASIIFFLALYIDVDKVEPLAKYLLYFIPYTHAVGMIESVVVGDVTLLITHTAVIIFIIIAFLYLTLKLFNEERIIYSKT